MPKTKKKTSSNPNLRKNQMQFRTDDEETRTINTKAVMYNKGKLSDFLRDAAINYKPIKKVSRWSGLNVF